MLLARANGQISTNENIPESSAEFAIETWRTENGIPQNTVSAVLQTRAGYIWAGTYNGVVQFDGLRFQVFDSSNTKGLANSRITSLHEDSSGVIWIGHDSGEVTRHTDEGFAAVKLSPDWKRSPIKDFVEDEQGDLWLLNQLGEALRVKDGRIVYPPPLMGESPFANPHVSVDAHHHSYVVRNGVVARFSSAGYEVMNFLDPSARPYYGGIAAARDGTLWVVGENRLRKWAGTNWLAEVAIFPWTNISVTTMLETSSGRVLVGTLQDGLLIFDPLKGWTRLDRNSGLPQDWICSLAEDSEKNIWVGTGGGLTLLRERKVAMLSPPDEWQGRPVLSITRAQNGAVWAATEGAGVYRLQDGAWTHFPLENLFVWSVFEDSEKRIWAGTWGGGLFRFENERFVAQTNLIPAADPVLAMMESPAGTLWVGTGAGLVRIRGNLVEHFAQLGGAAAGDVRALETGINGEVWIGTQGAGLGRWKNGQFQTFQTTNGLPGNFILSLHCETNGTLWIGTLDIGLCRYKDGKFTSINTTHGLPANIIYHIAADQRGNLWFNSPVGLFRISKQELNACADGTLAKLEVLTYGKTEGMSTIAGTGGFTPSGFAGPNGRLWFSTARGIAVVSPKSARSNPVPPPVWIESAIVDGQDIPIVRNSAVLAENKNNSVTARGLVVLQPGRRELDVQFTGLSFTSPDRVQFKYRLENLDQNWTPASTRRRVTFSFLPPGRYVFHVIACNSDGLWNETGDTLAILVLPQFWQTWWFKTLMILWGVLLLALVFFLESRSRLRRKLDRIARERALERERSRIAQDIHDDLGAGLTRIGLLSQSAVGDLEHPDQAAASLDQIHSTTRDLTRSMDEIVWAVNPRHDTLESLTNYISSYAHDFLSAAHIRCRLAMPLQVPDISVRSEIRHNLFLAIKEVLHNVVKHSHANEARLTMEFVPDGLRFAIADNGSGFDPQRLPPGAANRHATGNGLPNLSARMRQIGGHSKISSQPGEGTRVELFVPLADAIPAPRINSP